MAKLGSTVRSANLTTVQHNIADLAREAAREVQARWNTGAEADLPAAVEASPVLAADRSVFLELVQQEYRHRFDDWQELSLHEYCGRFRGVPAEFLLSAQRLLEVQQYFWGNPSLVETTAEYDWPEAGDDFAGFELCEELGRGATARVFAAREVNLGSREVVVKVTSHLREEAAVMGRFAHPHVSGIYSTGHDTATGLHWICLPLVSRSTLRQVLDGVATNPRSLQRPGESLDAARLRVAREICQGLAHIHSQGVFHGDIKPSNILISPECSPVLIDFNLARQESLGIGVFGGTLPYMAPEQLRVLLAKNEVSALHVTPASDIYSIGVVLDELFNGQLCFSAREGMAIETLVEDLLEQKLQRLPASATPKTKDYRAQLERLVDDCLAVQVAARPASATIVGERLQTIARELEHAEQLPQLRRRRRRVLTGSAGVLAALAAVVYAALPESPQQAAQRLLATGDRAGAVLELELGYQQPRLRRDPEFLRYFADVMLDEQKYQQADAALNELYLLTRSPSDGLMRAYCINRQGNHAGAEYFYQRLQKEGLESPVLSGNLAGTLLTILSANSVDGRISQKLGQHVRESMTKYPNDEPLLGIALRHLVSYSQRELLLSTYYDFDELMERVLARRNPELVFRALEVCAVVANSNTTEAKEVPQYQKRLEELRMALYREYLANRDTSDQPHGSTSETSAEFSGSRKYWAPTPNFQRPSWNSLAAQSTRVSTAD